MTYQEVNDRLTKVQTALQSIQSGTYNNATSIDVPQMTAQLQEAEVKLKEQLLVLAEQETGTVATDDETKAADLAKKGVNVKLTAEQEGIKFTVDETKAISREVGKAVAKALKGIGDELASMKVKNIEEGSFEIHVQYKKDTSTDDFSFYITGDDLHLVDFSFDKVVGSVGVKPSGEPIVHVDVIANELTKHWKSQMKEGMSDEEWADAEQNQRLEDHPEKDMIKKIQALIAKEKNQKEQIHPGYARSSQSNQYAKRAKVAKPSPEEKERRAKEDQAFKDRLKKVSGRLGIELREAPEGMFYLEVSIRDARKAMDIMDDMYRGQFEMNGSNVYYFGDESTAYDAMMDLGAQGIEIEDTNIEESVKENETPEGGMDQGGDLDIGHQDDEPNMLKKDLYDIATYAAKLYKQLDKYDKHDGEVDFPHWWQKKVTLAREYISSAQHFLEAEEKQPALDQLALEESKLNEIADPSYADMLAQFIILMGSGYGALQAVKILGDEHGDISISSIKDAIKQYKASKDVNEIGMFNDPVGYEKSEPEKPTYTKKYVSKNVYDIFKNGKKVKTIKGSEGEANAWMNNAKRSLDEDLSAEEVDENINESLNPEVSKAVARFIKAMAKRYGYTEQDAVYAIMAALKQTDFDGLEDGVVKESLNPEVSKAVARFIKAMAKRYGYTEQDAVYAIMAALKQTDFDGLDEDLSAEEESISKEIKKLQDENPEGYKDDIGRLKVRLAAIKLMKKNKLNEQTVADLKMGEKFTFNGNEYTFVELYPELPNAARVVLPNGRKTVISFGGGKVNTGKKADIGPDAFGQGKGHHIDEAQSTCCGKCGRKHVKGTKCKTPYLKGKDHCRTR